LQLPADHWSNIYVHLGKIERRRKELVTDIEQLRKSQASLLENTSGATARPETVRRWLK